MSKANMRLTSFAYGLPVVAFILVASPRSALAKDEGPCGNFDFSGNVSCSVQVQAACSASCDAPKVVIACSGKCTATSTQTCTDSCGTACIAECDPQLLDCFAGCHAECDQPAIDLCKEKKPGEDCVTKGKAQCDIHCKDNCKVPDSNCQEHCTKCCSGSCQTQVNFDCDFGCMAEASVNCKAQCTKPTGGIFCNGQFVNATDVDACITHLATKLSIKVDASARGSASGGCSSGNCGGEASGGAKVNVSNPSDSGGKGCASAPGSSNGITGVLVLLGLVSASATWARRRKNDRL
jgi:hypothetical protein